MSLEVENQLIGLIGKECISNEIRKRVIRRSSDLFDSTSRGVMPCLDKLIKGNKSSKSLKKREED